jgi:hypothetical protein
LRDVVYDRSLAPQEERCQRGWDREVLGSCYRVDVVMPIKGIFVIWGSLESERRLWCYVQRAAFRWVSY